jgi:hypothetical protein
VVARALALAALVTLLGACGAARPAGPPTSASVIAHGEEGAQLGIADFATGRLEPVGPAGGAARQAVWSPDGARLAYRVADRLFVHTPGAAADALLAEGVELGAHAYAFSPDGARVAVALRGAAVTVAADGAGAPRSLGAFPGRRVGELAWAPDGGSVVLLVEPVPPANAATSEAAIVRVPAAGGAGSARPANGISRFLGWRGADLLAVRTDGTRQALAVVSEAGIAEVQIPAEQRIVEYLAAPDELVLALAGEDNDVALSRMPAHTGAEPRRWLADLPAIGEVCTSADGRWALVIDAGRVLRTRTNTASTEVVLAATPARSYSAACPRPR